MVIIVAKATMILLGEKVNMNDAEGKIWKKAQIFMQNPIKFIEIIKAFKPESIDEGVLENVNKVIDEHSDEFTYEKMTQKSQAAAYLCTYIWKMMRICVKLSYKLPKNWSLVLKEKTNVA